MAKRLICSLLCGPINSRQKEPSKALAPGGKSLAVIRICVWAKALPVTIVGVLSNIH